MANVLTAVTPKLLAGGLMALRQNSISPRLVNRRYEALAGEKGSTIDVPIPSSMTAIAVSPSHVPPAVPAGNEMAPTSVPIVLDQWFESPFYLTDKDIADAMNGILPMQASEAIKALVNNVDSYILALYKKFYGFVWEAATTTDIDDTYVVPFTNGTTVSGTSLRKVLSNQLAPLGDRNVIFSPDVEASALNIRAFQDVSWTGDPAAIIEGQLNRRLGFSWWMNQNVPNHTAGTKTGTVTVTTAAAVGVQAVLVGTAAGGAIAFVEGDIIKFGNHSQTYVVTAPVTAGASATNVSIPIAPSLQVALTTSDVLSKVAKNREVNLAFHRDAIAFATRPLQVAADGLGVITQNAVDAISGLTLRLEITHEHKRTRFSYDILYGAATIRRELGAQFASPQ